MNYGIGDKIKHGAYGECEITDRRTEYFGSKVREVFVLTQCGGSSTIFVPVDKADGFKEIKSPLTLNQISELKNCRCEWINFEKDDKTRDSEFKNAFMRDDTSEIAGILLALIARRDCLKNDKKKLRATDANAIKTCEKILYDELSRTLDLRLEDVIPLLTGEQEPVLK